MIDRELDELFKDPDLLQTARLLQRAQAPRVEPDPAFRSALRRQLMQQAWNHAEPRVPWWRRLFAPGPLAWAGAAVGAVLIVFVAITMSHNPGGSVTTLTYSSALQGQQAVALAQPIEITFNQPMDHQSVQDAIVIEPATTNVDYQWSGNTIKIIPKSQLAANTTYQVTVNPAVATTTTGTHLAATSTAAPPITFTTQPQPTPTPTPAPRPTPPPPPALSSPRPLADLGPGGRFVGWSPDGSKLFLIGPAGQLESVPAAGGQSTVLVPDGVRIAALSSDGSTLLYVRAGRLAVQPTAPGGKPTDLGAGDAGSLGWQGETPVYVSGTTVYSWRNGAPTKLAGLGTNTPAAAIFSPRGDRLLYQVGASTGHVLDLTTSKDTVLSLPAGIIFGWSPSGSRVLIGSGDAIYSTDLTGAAAVKLAASSDLGGAPPGGTPASADWSSRDLVLIWSGAGLWIVHPDGTGLARLDAAEYSQPDWSPGGTGFVFRRQEALWIAQVTQLPTATSGVQTMEEAYNVINSFMTARLAGQADQATAFLDAAGKQSFSASGATLIYAGDPALGRWFPVFSQLQPGTPPAAVYTARLVLTPKAGGVPVSTVDETLTLERDAAGKLLIHRAAAGASRPALKGPEVISVVVAAGQLQVTFDSDLQASTVVAGVVVRDAAGKPVAASAVYANRTVTLTLQGVTGAGPYTLAALPTLKDATGRPLTSEYDLAFIAVAPAPAPSPTASPSASPSPSPSATG